MVTHGREQWKGVTGTNSAGVDADHRRRRDSTLGYTVEAVGEVRQCEVVETATQKDSRPRPCVRTRRRVVDNVDRRQSRERAVQTPVQREQRTRGPACLGVLT